MLLKYLKIHMKIAVSKPSANKVAGFQLASLLRKRLQHRRVLEIFNTFLRTCFYRTPLDDCFWNLTDNYYLALSGNACHSVTFFEQLLYRSELLLLIFQLQSLFFIYLLFYLLLLFLFVSLIFSGTLVFSLCKLNEFLNTFMRSANPLSCKILQIS